MKLIKEINLDTIYESELNAPVEALALDIFKHVRKIGGTEKQVRENLDAVSKQAVAAMWGYFESLLDEITE